MGEKCGLPLECQLVHVLRNDKGILRDLRLRFFATIPCRWWVGTVLRTPCFPVSDHGIEAGIHAWRQLRDAYCQVSSFGNTSPLRCCDPQQLAVAWSRLRDAYAEVWRDA